MAVEGLEQPLREGLSGEEVRALTEQITSASEHLLDWFLITMRLTVLGQFARGVAHDNERQSAESFAGACDLLGAGRMAGPALRSAAVESS